VRDVNESPALSLDQETSAGLTPSAQTPRSVDLGTTLVHIFQSLLVSGVPTLMVVGTVMMLVFGMDPFEGGALSLRFTAVAMFIDTALVALLILLFLTLSGETSRAVFVGPRSPAREFVRGLLLVPITYIGVTAVVMTIRILVPALQTVPDNPMTQFMRSPLDAAIFLVVVVLAGGVREELQRAFVLHKFRHSRMSLGIALVAFTLLFGALHFDQGWDVAIGVGLLGLFWGILYIRRRSAIMAMTNHAGFNAVQVLSQLVASSLGM
jgi:membrane protease YdiL (CAAX protease family)